MTKQVSIITSFGRTGSGKSYLGNQLTKPGTFAEGDTLESQTTTISSAVSWNGRDTVSDVPGYFDTQGRDEIQQANFVDYLEGKWVKAILLVFTDRADAFFKQALRAFYDSELRNNVILVVNKDLDVNHPADITALEGFPLIYVKAHQTNLDVLKRYIDSMTAVYVKTPPTPESLLKQPLKIVKTEEVSEFQGNIEVPEKETVLTTRSVAVQRSRQEWNGPPILGRKKTVTWTEHENVTDTQEVVVNKLYASYNVYKLTYAERFDGKASLYKKEFIRTDKRKL